MMAKTKNFFQLRKYLILFEQIEKIPGIDGVTESLVYTLAIGK